MAKSEGKKNKRREGEEENLSILKCSQRNLQESTAANYFNSSNLFPQQKEKIKIPPPAPPSLSFGKRGVWICSSE